MLDIVRYIVFNQSISLKYQLLNDSCFYFSKYYQQMQQFKNITIFGHISSLNKTSACVTIFGNLVTQKLHMVTLDNISSQYGYLNIEQWTRLFKGLQMSGKLKCSAQWDHFYFSAIATSLMLPSAITTHYEWDPQLSMFIKPIVYRPLYLAQFQLPI